MTSVASYSKPLLLLHFLLLQMRASQPFLTSGAPYSNQTAVAPTPCLRSQASALLMLRRSFAFDNCFTSWQAGTDCCSWHGVRCDAGDGRVTSLDLALCHNEVRHGLRAFYRLRALFRLTSLKYLNLSGNDLGGVPLPRKGFERLTKLTHLNLSDANIAGQIPIGIAQINSLVSLDLSTNFGFETSDNEHLVLGTNNVIFPQLQEPNFQTLVANLSNLRELRLGFVDISNVGAKWCDALADSTPRLQLLSLPFCSLSGSICKALSRLGSLAVIDLQYNNLQGPVPEFLADLPSLRVLQLSSNDLQGWFPPRIFQHTKLGTLDMRNNTRLRGELPVFKVNTGLRNLVLRRTNFSGDIPSSISNLRSLEVLDLAAGFSGDLPSSIAVLENLTVLTFSGFGLTGSIPYWVANLTSLTVLEFSNCGLGGPIPSDLLCSLVNLERLVLNNCNFSGSVVIPPCVGNVSESQLLSVVLRSNAFTGLVELTTFWKKLRYLDHLDLSNNRLSVVDGEGNFSTDSLPQIRDLLLASCNLSKFPSALLHLNTIVNLDLSSNQISGAIPRSLWEIWGLGPQTLNLSHNQLTNIGRYLHSMDWLYSIDLSFNMFEGILKIPPSAPLVLDYSNNRFSAIDPSSTAYLCYARIIRISRNNLSGIIPPSLCCARTLEILDISYNNLNGSIPSCLIEEANALRILSLKANQLVGNLHLHNISSSCALEAIDLNNNRIEGKLPRSLVACKSLEILDVGNNRIFDSFPCWLGALPKLQVLVLKSNNFSGQVGHPTGETSSCEFPGLRIVELASNNFSGSLQDEWFKSFRSMMVRPDNESSAVMGDQNLAYQFSVTLTIKGSVDITITKISNALVLMDVSNNAFQGSIPESVGKLVLLKGLNMSHNAYTGPIPSQLGGLDQLESLDLSWNELTGEIPQQLASLDFLQVLNLSYNSLVGTIPGSPHFLTFARDSFLGNPGLCGSQLSIPCDNKTTPNTGPFSKKRSSVDILLFLFVGIGVGVGLAIVIVLKWGFRK